jgi:hypothetical protein
MKIRLDEEILNVGDYRIVRIDDYNVEIQERIEGEWEFVGYYGWLSHALRQVFKLTLNKARKTTMYKEMLGDTEECLVSLAKSVSRKGIDDFPAYSKLGG